MIDEKVQKQRDAIAAQMAKQIQLEIDTELIKSLVDAATLENSKLIREAFKELDMAQANGREPADWALEQIANAL
tara:strand:- start:240 stop:464 length:225 start_codon:yes stop_codon:yes gene_type:complete